MIKKFVVWVDGDACPKDVKEVVFKFSFKFCFKVKLVANSYVFTPPSKDIEFIKVDMGADVADNYIIDHLNSGDIVITADIPLAASAVEKGAVCLNPRGELYDEENVREKLSVRNFMQDLRDNGVMTKGPAAFGAKDKELFTNAFHRIISKK